MTDVEIPVKQHVYAAMQAMDSSALSACSEVELRPVLPGLVRIALCNSLDLSDESRECRNLILSTLSGLESVNSIVDMLSIDFHALEQDVKKEQQLRSKLGSNMTESVLVSQLQYGLALEFERSETEPAQRIRLLLSELLFVQSELKEQKAGNYTKQSDLFECPVYQVEIVDALCIAIAELPNLLNPLDLFEALLCLENGPKIICQIVANSPESFLEVCNSIVMRGEKQEEDSVGGRRRLLLLQMLCTMNPRSALTVRNLCVEHCTMPAFAISVSLKSNEPNDREDVVPFLTSLLLGADTGIRNWLSSFVKAGQKRRPEAKPSVLMLLREYLYKHALSLTPSKDETMSEANTVLASALIRLYCALKGIATMKYTDEEIGALLKLVISHTEPSKAGVHFISLAICMLIASPGLLRTLDEEQQIIAWLRWLLNSAERFQQYSEKTDSPSEMLFLIALSFHNNQMHAITDLVCNTLGMKSTVKASALVKIRQIFTMELFTEQVVAAHAVKIPVTENMDAKSTGYLPVHSILQLLKSRVFSKHKVSVKAWVYRQIRNSCFPLHPMLPQLIESYVNSVIPKSTKLEHTNEPLSESEILSVFGSHGNSSDNNYRKGKELCSQLLILYYLLQFEDLYQHNKKFINVSRLPQYSDDVMSQIPISFLVQESLKHSNNCQNLFPSMIRLLTSHFPHLCLVEDWLDVHVGLMSDQHAHLTVRRSPVSITPDDLYKALLSGKDKPWEAIEYLQQLLSQDNMEIFKTFQDVLVSSLPALMEPGIPRHLLNMVNQIWFRMHAFMPRRLRLNTVNALQPYSSIRLSSETASNLTEQDLVVDPLVVLRCDDRVFRCPPVLEIVLRILSAYSQACRVFLNSHVVDTGGLEKEKDRQELKVALIAAQESAIVQILLELCLPLPSETNQEESELSDLREVRCSIFSYIHQLFIADPNLAKLVHFQGYPSQLLPLVVTGIPSMHICLDFIPELLGQPQRNKQIFGVQLLAQLCCQYHLPKSINVAKLGIDVMFTLSSVLESTEWLSFFCQTIPSLLSMCEAFPPLCDDSTLLMTQLGRVCYSHMTVEGNPQHTEYAGKEDAITKSAKKIDSLNSYEKLYDIIQATFSQICGKALVLGRIY